MAASDVLEMIHKENVDNSCARCTNNGYRFNVRKFARNGSEPETTASRSGGADQHFGQPSGTLSRIFLTNACSRHYESVPTRASYAFFAARAPARRKHSSPFITRVPTHIRDACA